MFFTPERWFYDPEERRVLLSKKRKFRGPQKMGGPQKPDLFGKRRL